MDSKYLIISTTSNSVEIFVLGVKMTVFRGDGQAFYHDGSRGGKYRKL